MREAIPGLAAAASFRLKAEATPLELVASGFSRKDAAVFRRSPRHVRHWPPAPPAGRQMLV